MLSRKHCLLPKPSAERHTRSPVPVQDSDTMSSVRRKETSSAPPSSSDMLEAAESEAYLGIHALFTGLRLCTSDMEATLLSFVEKITRQLISHRSTGKARSAQLLCENGF